MKNLKSVTDHELLSETRTLAAEERRLGVEILYHLREIETRQLHLRDGYSSLHEFAVKELRYSDGAAHRRIQAARLLQDLPEVEENLKSGILTLTNASQLQDFFRAERKLGKTYAKEEKSELIKEMSGKSARQALALLSERSPEAIPKEALRPVGEDESKLTVVISRELEEKLKRLKGLLAHRLPNATYAELLEAMADLALKDLDPQLKGGHRPKSDCPAEGPTHTAEEAPAQKLGDPTHRSRSIPIRLKRLVWKRAQGRCELEASGRRCTSRYALEMDHIVPVGKNGRNSSDNLRLLCKAHNLHKNLTDYGFIYRVAKT